MTSANPSKTSGSTVAIGPPTTAMTPRDLTSLNLDQPPALDAHAGQADQVGTAETVEVDILDVLID